MRRLITTLVLSAAAALNGCKVGPDQASPAAITPDAWVEPPTEHARVPSVTLAVPADLTRWWEALRDPVLTSLIERAAAANLDLAQADARIRGARASRDIAGSGLWPGVGASASAARSRGPGGESSLFRAGLDASWEVDVFGGVRRGVEAAEADLDATVEARRDTLITLTAEVALAYADLRGAQRQLSFAQRNLQIQLETASIVRQRYEAGFVSQLDAANADTQAANTRARIPSLEATVRRSIYAIALLLARQPGELLAELSPDGAIPVVPPQVPIGLPSDLLRRRPDIRIAEANIHAATARIGVAVADLYPRFSLGGSLGISGSQLADVGRSDNGFWSIGPSVSWNLFQGGAVRANIRAQEAASDATLAAYQQTVLTALNEVETSLVAYEKEQVRHASLVDAAASSKLALELATKRYTEGVSDFLDVLSAQGSLSSTEDALAQSDRQVVQNLVTIYKSLGGGWEEPPTPVSRDVGPESARE